MKNILLISSSIFLFGWTSNYQPTIKSVAPPEEKSDSIGLGNFIQSRTSALRTLISIEWVRHSALKDKNEKERVFNKILSLNEMVDIHIKNKSISKCLYNIIKKTCSQSKEIYFVEGMNYHGESNSYFVYSSFQIIDSLSCGLTPFKIKNIDEEIINNCNKKDVNSNTNFNDWFIVTKVSSNGLHCSFYVDPNNYMKEYFKYFR